MSGEIDASVESESVSVGEALIRHLEHRGVDTVFGIPGVHTVELYRGLAASAIRHVTPRHEQGAAFMADGYARASGRPGVCLLITGPGLTNAITGMAQARADRVPMLVISGVNRRETLGRGLGCLHELPDQGALAASVALSTRTLLAPEDLDDALDEAFRVLHGPRPGPVHLEIPVDVMSARIAVSATRGASDRTTRDASGDGVASRGAAETTSRTHPETGPSNGSVTPPPDEGEVERARASCLAARRPLILAGGGCVRAASGLRRLAERLDAPVVSTVNARGLIAGHPLDVPASPSLDSVRALVAESDLVLALGTEMGPTDHDMYERGPMPAPACWLRVDTDPEQLARPPCATHAVLADAGAFVDALVTALIDASIAPFDEGSSIPKASPSSAAGHGTTPVEAPDETPGRDGAARAHAARESALAEIGADYRRLLDVVDGVWRALPSAAIVGDSTQPVYAGNLYVEAPRPRAWFNSATGYGTLGYAPPAAVGAWFGDPASPVVCLVGDGGLQFSLAEIGSARDVDADVAFVVWNNAGYLEIESAMTAAGIVPVGVTPSPPDFVAVAAAYGLSACRVRDGAGLERALASLSRPCLIEFDVRELPEA